jgi:pyrroloquinoline-quinone synthase
MSTFAGPNAFAEELRAVGTARYHDKHPFHSRMHAGDLSRDELRRWVLNRYYYQTRIPIKDALILSKAEDPGFRRVWIKRIFDHDGRPAEQGQMTSEGGLEQWRRLAAAVGCDVDEVTSLRSVLPNVRSACNAYVQFVREHSLLEAVAASLTELFAPELMSRRVDAWLAHYAWVEPAGLDYFRTRVKRAERDSLEAMNYVVMHATVRDMQVQCIKAVELKCAILWALLDAVEAAGRSARTVLSGRPTLASMARLRDRPQSGDRLLLSPERGLELSESAAVILSLCDGSRTVDELVSALSANYDAVERETIAGDVDEFLKSMVDRGVLRLVVESNGDGR